MKFICDRQLLTDAINTVQRAIGVRTTMQILEGIHLEASNEGLRLQAYDLSIGIQVKVQAQVSEKGVAVLPGKLFGEIVRNFPEDEIQLELIESKENSANNEKKQTVRIHGPRAEYKFEAMKGEYPALPMISDSKSISIPQSLFKRMVQETLFAASRDDNRPVLNGINVHIENKQIELCAIDGFRMAIARAELKEDSELSEKVEFLVPLKAMSELAHIIGDNDEALYICTTQNHILMYTEKMHLISRLIQGEFLPYEKLIPSSCTSKIRINTKEFLESISRISAMISTEAKRVPITLTCEGEDVLTITTVTSIGNAEELIKIENEGQDFTMDFNPKFFVDALRVIDDESIYLENNANTSPCIIKPLEGDSYLYMILPLRR